MSVLLNCVSAEGPYLHRPNKKLIMTSAVVCRWVLLGTPMWPSVFLLRAVAPLALVVLRYIV